MTKNIFEQTGLEGAIEILKEELGDLDLENNSYILKTKDACLTLGLEDDDEDPGKKKITADITDKSFVLVETDKRPFSFLYGSSEDED